MLYNPYFTQMLNPAYLDVIDCPYLNYAKNPEESSIESNKQCSTVPEQNVSDFLDSLKYDWESLPKATKEEYYSKLAQMLQDKSVIENFENLTPTINTNYHHENTLYIIYFLTILGFIVYFLNINNMGIQGHIYLAIYLIIIVIGTGAYYFSYI